MENAYPSRAIREFKHYLRPRRGFAKSLTEILSRFTLSAMASVVRPFRGISAEERIARRRASLIEAGLDEVAEVGVAQLKMSSVCERASLIHRYFYEHFRNRDELLDALFQVMINEMITRTMEAVDARPLDLLDRARVAVDVFLACFVEEPRHARLFTEAAGNPVVAARKAEGIGRYVEYTAAQVELVLGASDEHTRARVELAARVVITGQAETSLLWHHGEIALSRDEYIDAISRVFVDALLSARNPLQDRLNQPE